MLTVVLLVLLLLPACSDKHENKTGKQTPAKTAVKPLAFEDEAGKVLERVTTVLSGYQAYSGHAAQALADLDGGDYMFGSDYLADVVPAGSKLYLQFGQNLAEVHMWLEKEGEKQVVSRTLGNPRLSVLTAQELQSLKSRWQQVASVGRLSQVKL